MLSTNRQTDIVRWTLNMILVEYLFDFLTHAKKILYFFLEIKLNTWTEITLGASSGSDSANKTSAYN